MERKIAVKPTRKSVESYLTKLIEDYGVDNELETFGYCSDYGIELADSTIDKIVKSGDTFLFYYNENTGDCDSLPAFKMGDVLVFAMDIKKAIKEEEEIAYAENYGEGAVARHDLQF